jgi:hypothetical protein
MLYLQQRSWQAWTRLWWSATRNASGRCRPHKRRVFPYDWHNKHLRGGGMCDTMDDRRRDSPKDDEWLRGTRFAAAACAPACAQHAAFACGPSAADVLQNCMCRHHRQAGPLLRGHPWAVNLTSQPHQTGQWTPREQQQVLPQRWEATAGGALARLAKASPQLAQKRPPMP